MLLLLVVILHVCALVRQIGIMVVICKEIGLTGKASCHGVCFVGDGCWE